MYSIIPSKALEELANSLANGHAVLIDTSMLTPLFLPDENFVSQEVPNGPKGSCLLDVIGDYSREGFFPSEFKCAALDYIQKLNLVLKNQRLLVSPEIYREFEIHQRMFMKIRGNFKKMIKHSEQGARRASRIFGEEVPVMRDYKGLFPKIAPFVKKYSAALNSIISCTELSEVPDDSLKRELDDMANGIEAYRQKFYERERPFLYNKKISEADKSLVSTAIHHSSKNGSGAIIVSRDGDITALLNGLSPARKQGKIIYLHEKVRNNGEVSLTVKYI